MITIIRNDMKMVSSSILRRHATVCYQALNYQNTLIVQSDNLRLQGRYLLIFGGIVLASKSITTHGFILQSVSVMISSLNDY